MKLLKKYKMKKTVRVMMLCIIGLLVTMSVSVYLILHSYINKMNIVSISDSLEIDNSFLENEYDIEEEKDFLENETTIFHMEASTQTTEESESKEAYVSLDKLNDEIDLLEEKIHQNIDSQSTLNKEHKDVLNILLIGSDTRSSKERGRSDTMILISINKKSKTITATSLLRDIYLNIPGKSKNRLNASYQYGGAALLMDTIEENFKIKIDQYVSVNFFTFMNIVDVIGGITIEITKEEIEPINYCIMEINEILKKDEKEDLLTSAGVQHINGKQALCYSRIRSVGNSDFTRTKRQRKVIEQIFIEVKNMNFIELNDLLNEILPEITTNFKEREIITQLFSLPAYMKYDIEYWSIPMSGTYKNLRIRGMSVLGIDFDKNIKELHSRIYLTD